MTGVAEPLTIHGNAVARETAGGRVEILDLTERVAALSEKDAIPRRTELSMTPEIRELLVRIEGEYREMPGLSLTMRQAERLWGLDRRKCELVLATLIERRVLRRASNGKYLRGPRLAEPQGATRLREEKRK
jgi:hypothetical protein